MKLLAHGLLLGDLLFTHLTTAQPIPKRLVCPTIVMPPAAQEKAWRTIETAIYQHLIFPPVCLRDEVNGRVFISLTVAPTGSVQQVRTLKLLYEPFDAAVVKAARQLRFQPRPRKEGMVSFSMGISWEKAVSLLPTTEARRPNPTPRRNPKP